MMKKQNWSSTCRLMHTVLQ